MKIAIMTQPLGKNYGGIMQAWALQQVLKRMGHEPVTIDRQPDAIDIKYKIARLSYRTALKVIGKRKAPINFEHHLPHIYQNTNLFISQNIVMSEPMDSTEKLRKHFHENNYDAVIVGSDQTWRPKYSPNINNFFLDFLEKENIRKIAYATSFGVDEWEFNPHQSQECSRLAKEFLAISVREESGIELCRNNLNVDASLALDPTLLLKKEDYYELLKKSNKIDKNEGIYTYLLDKTEEANEAILHIAKKINQPVFSNQAKYNIKDHDSGNIDDYIMPSIESWISGFSNANFVITDSFHGMVFSIIFNKPFLAIVNEERGASRFRSIAKIFNLERRLINKNIKEIDTDLLKQEPLDFHHPLNFEKRASSIEMLSKWLRYE